MSGIILSTSVSPDNILLQTYRPDSLIIEVDKPTDMASLVKLSKLAIPIFPLFTLGNARVEVLESMISQARDVLGTKTVYIRTNQRTGSAAAIYIDQLIHEWMRQRDYELVVLSMASQFMNRDTCAYTLWHEAQEARIKVRINCILSNTPQSMSILEDEHFIHLMNKNPEIEFSLLLLLSDNLDLQELFNLNKTMFFFGMPAFTWYRQNTMRKNGSIEYVPDKIIALAKVLRDRETAWSTPKLNGTVTRKLFIGQPDLQIIEILPGHVGKTVQGDFIKLANFEVQHV